MKRCAVALMLCVAFLAFLSPVHKAQAAVGDYLFTIQGGFAAPHGIAVDPYTHNILVADSGNNRVVVFNQSGTNILTIRMPDLPVSGDGTRGVAANAYGEIFVADTTKDRILVFDYSGNELRRWGSTGDGDGQFRTPVRISISPNNEVYVSDEFNYRVQVFNFSGTFQRKIQVGGIPMGNAVDAQSNFYVSTGSSIQVFNTAGTLLKTLIPPSPYSFGCGLAWDANNYLYTNDEGNNRIVRIDTNGTFISTWGLPGTGNGQFNRPNGIAVDNELNRIYVVDGGNNRVQVFSGSGGVTGTFAAWGRNDSGQLGDGTTQSQFYPVGVALDSVAKLAAGMSHSVVLKSDGSVWTAGSNNQGQLGLGVSDYNPHPTFSQVLSGVTAIAAAQNHTLAVSGGIVYSCGSNESGQLGYGYADYTFHPSFQPVPNLDDVIAVDTYWNYSMALKSDGTVWIWGTISATPDNYAPRQVTGLPHITQIAAGNNTCLALDSTHIVFTWQPGGDPIPIPSLLGALSIDAGQWTGGVALMPGGTVWVWGDMPGLYGNGSTSVSPTPVQANISGVTKLVSASLYIFAIKDDGSLWAWGCNCSGEQGNGSQGGWVSQPAQVAGIDKVTDVAGGMGQSLAIRNAGGTPPPGCIPSVDAGPDRQIITESLPVDVYLYAMVNSCGMQYSCQWYSGPAMPLGPPGCGISIPFYSGAYYPYVVVNFNSGLILQDGTQINVIYSDTTPPETVAVDSGTIGENDIYVSDVAVNFNSYDSGGVEKIEWYEDSHPGDINTIHGNSGSVNFTTDGYHGIYYRARDNAGNWEQFRYLYFTVDRSAPNGAIFINGGDEITRTNTVTMTLDASDATSGVALMSFSNDTLSWTGWEAYQSSKPWTLPGGEGEKTVWARFKDQAGNISEVFSDTIVYRLPFRIITTSLGYGRIGAFLSRSLATAGGEPPYSWTVDSGSLPEGLRLDALTGGITGTPTVFGSFSFTLKATDGQQATATKYFDLPIIKPVREREIQTVYLRPEQGNLVTPNHIAVNPQTSKIYVTGGKVAVIDAVTRRVTAVLPLPNGAWGVDVNPVTNQVYIVDGSNLYVIDGSTDTIVTTVAVPGNNVAVNPQTNRIYVQGGSDYVYVFDGSTNQKIGQIGLKFSGHDIAVNPSNNRIYVSYQWYAYGNIAVIDGNTNSVIRYDSVDHGEITHVAVDQATNKVYALDWGGMLYSFNADGRNNGGTQVGLNGGAHGLDFNSLTGMAYITNMINGKLYVFDTQKNSLIATLDTEGDVSDLTVDQTANLIYIPNQHRHSISVIDGRSNTIAEAIIVGSQPGDLASNEANGRLYVAGGNSRAYTIDGITGNILDINYLSPNPPAAISVNPENNRIYFVGAATTFDSTNRILVMDGGTNIVTKRIGLGNGIATVNLAVNSSTNRIYTCNHFGGTMSVINGGNDTVIKTIPTAVNFRGIGVDESRNLIYGVTFMGGTSKLWIVDGTSNTVRQTVTFPGEAYSLAVDADLNKIFVADYTGKRIYVFDGTNFAYRSILLLVKPYDIAVNKLTHKAYVTHYSGNEISVINGIDEIVEEKIIAGNAPSNVTVNEVLNHIYVSHQPDGTITIIREAPLTPPDADPPVGSVVVNSDADYTNAVEVTLSLTCDDGGGSGCAQMSLSSDGTSWGPPESFTSARLWTLASGDGLKTVYVKFSDEAGNWSGSYNDSITLDTTSPDTTLTLNGTVGNNGWFKSSVTVDLSADDDFEVREIRYVLDGGQEMVVPGGLAAVNVEAGGSHSISAHAVDAAGNKGAAKSADFKLDVCLPAVSIDGLDDGLTYYRGFEPQPSCRASDAISDIAVKSCFLSGGDALGMGTFTYTAMVWDNAGNLGQLVYTYQVIATSESTIEVINDLLESGVVEAGTANVLLQAIANAQATYDRNNELAGDNKVESLINYIEAQTGKHIDEATARILLDSANYILNQ